MWRWPLALLLSCAAASPVTPAPLVRPPRLPLVLPGPAAGRPRAASCEPQTALAGRPTVAAGWGQPSVACRTGPPPRATLARRLRNDLRWQRCLEAQGVSWLEGRLRLGASGEVIALVIDELEPERAPVEACLRHLTRTTGVAAGCELEGRVHFARLE